MSEIIFEKSRKNLKKVYNRLKTSTVAEKLNLQPVLILAMGGYNRTFELLTEMGVERNEISVFPDFNYNQQDFLKQTHSKKVLMIRSFNFVTDSRGLGDASRKELNVTTADNFSGDLSIYRYADRLIAPGTTNQKRWLKPSVVVLDDPSFNLQHSGYRFRFVDIGFVQVKNRVAEPKKIIEEIRDVEEADRMMFALYQPKGEDEEHILKALANLSSEANRFIGDEESFIYKPTEYKRLVGSNNLANKLKEIPELGITQLKKNKKYGKENARWVVVPMKAFDFKGFEYQDEDDVFKEELLMEEEAERKFEKEQKEKLDEMLSEEVHLNITNGYIGQEMGYAGKVTLESFVAETDEINENTKAIDMLKNATTEKEYKAIKEQIVIYFLDGQYKDNKRADANYLGGKKLISIDVDEGDYNRSEIEDKLEGQGLFGIVYPTTKNYFDGSKRWRIILVADQEMDKENYKTTVEGVGKLLDIEIDAASKKISQLMGYPFKEEDITMVAGSKVNVSQFEKKKKEKETEPSKIINFDSEKRKSLLDFNNKSAKKTKYALENGIEKGKRNETYYEIIRFLRDIQEQEEWEPWRDESYLLEDKIRIQMKADGLSDKEIETICRAN